MTYNSNVDTFMVSVAYDPTSKLSFSMNSSYSLASSKMHDIHFDSDVHKDGQRLEAWGKSWKGTYDPATNNGMENFSKLDYSILDINVGATYALNESIDLGVNYHYSDTDAGEEYVYGDESGEHQAVMGFVTFRF